MNSHEARELLRQALAEYRGLSYPELAARVGTSAHTEVAGASGVDYQLEIQVLWDGQSGGDVRVLAAVDDGRWRAFFPLTDALVMSPAGTLLEERAAEPDAPSNPQGD